MVFGLFNKEKALRKTIERATNSLAQSADRWGAMEKLAEMGTDEALFGLCKRFSITADKSIEDQQEKDWMIKTLVVKGEAALGPLRRYMKGASHLGLPLKALSQMTTEDKVLEVIDEILATEEPGYVRDPKRRIDVIEWLGEWSASPEHVVKRVLPYVEDFDENVRFKTVETISLKPHDSAAETVARAMVNPEEESQRFQLRCAELLAEQGWPVTPHKDEVSALCSSVLSRFSLSGDTLKAA